MVALKDLVCPSSRTLGEYSYERPAAVGGIILLVLAVIAAYFLYPEIRRYLRISRM